MTNTPFSITPARSDSPAGSDHLSTGRRVAWLALALLAYVLLGVLTLSVFQRAGVMSIIWPSSGVAFAVMLLAGRVAGSVAAVGAVITCLLSGYPLAVALGLAAGNVVEVLVGYELLRHRYDFSDAFERPRDFFLLLAAAAPGTLASALLGSGVLLISGDMPAHMYLMRLLNWWQAEFLGVMLITPLILVWRHGFSRQEMTPARVLETIACLLLGFVCGQIVLVGWDMGTFVSVAYGYWLFLFIAWAAIRCGRRVMMLVLAMIVVQGLVGVFSGKGLFATDPAYNGLMNLWAYVVMLGGIGIALAVLLTERKISMQALRREKQLSDDILNSLPGVFYMLDEAGRYQRWNTALTERTGHAAEEMAGRSALELIAEADREHAVKGIQQVFSRGEATLEAGLLGKDGKVTPYHFTGKRIMIDGQTRLVGLGHDVTARRQMDDALLESEQRYRLLFQNNTANIILLDLDGVILMMNEANARMLGGRVEDFVGGSLYKLIPPNMTEKYRQRFAAVVRGEAKEIYEDPFPFADGVHWYSTQLNCATDAHGKPYGIQLLAVDITKRKQMEDELRTNELKYRQLFENTNTNITILDSDGIILMLNEANARMLGGQPADFIGRSLRELDPERADAQIARYREILQSGVGQNVEEMFPLADGPHWFSAHLQPLVDTTGKPTAIQVVAFDVTERKCAEEALRRSEELWKFALEGTGDSVWDWDIEQDKTMLSSRWKVQLGYAEDEEVGSWFEHVHPDDLHIVENISHTLRVGEVDVCTAEVRVRCKDGGWKWLLTRGMGVSRDASGRPLRVVGTNADVTLQKEHQRQLEQLAHYDALTGLPSRLLLGVHLEQALVHSQRRQRTLAVVYLDLDGFKAVNDNHGHDVGDELLMLVAPRMKMALREGDTLARIGGDEFIAVLVDLAQPQDCEPVLERLLQAVATPLVVGEANLCVSVSVGVALFPGDGADAGELIRRADQAMYMAKQAGKNRYQLFGAQSDARM